MAGSILIPRPIVQKLFAQAQLDPEDEVCGLIGARNGEVVSVYPVKNVSGNPASRFSMDASGQIDAMKRLRNNGEELFAIYHSHPSTPPVPSDIDLDELAYPEALMLIMSLNIKGVLELRAWQPDGEEIHERDVKIIED